MKSKLLGAPPTPAMKAALILLADHGDYALVRLYGHWWVCESERRRASTVGPALVEVGGRVVVSMNHFLPDPVEIGIVRTSAVNGLVARGLLKFVGRKARNLGSAAPMAHQRAELTPLGRTHQAQQLQAATAAAGDALRKATTAR